MKNSLQQFGQNIVDCSTIKGLKLSLLIVVLAPNVHLQRIS